MRRSLRLITWSALILALVAVGAAAWLAWWLRQPLPIPPPAYAFDVRSGASLTSVARELAAAGVVPHEHILIALARWEHEDRNIKAGNYEIPVGTTLPMLLARLTQGDVTLAALTIVEGSTFAELKRALAGDPRVAKTMLDLDDAALMAKLGSGHAQAEGWFFPETYFFSSGASDLALLRRAHRLMVTRLEHAWAKRASDLPLTDPYQALILASIVEKETGRDADRPLVASVFINRLRIGMRLQTDPTVIYGLGARFDGNLRRRDLETDHPFNTYTREGLPPTPIALPGQGALEAVLNPPRTDYLYFVARGDGSSQFSANLADHARAVARYQKGRP
ncbi:MAG: endolytic transglycosylase MltG [Casimicrobiaceae bacterium]